MKKCFKVLLVLLLASIIGLFFLYRYLECNPIRIGGGGPSNPLPARCYAKEQEQQRKTQMAQLEQLAALEFTCKKEERPPLSKETQQLYNYALYHDLHNMWTGDKGDDVWNGLARYYRIAAANGDYKANVRYGVRTEKDGKYAYLRKAADLGSREAQYTVAEMLADIEDSEETQEAFKYRLALVEQLRTCASEQGLGEASSNLGISFQMDKKYPEALKVFHQGVKNGDVISALNLSSGFSQKINKDDLNFLNLSPDEERSKRYDIIRKYLSRNDYLQPKVPDLDEIVPLPPAKLPKWDGKIAFQRWYEGEAPPKPSEALMQKLANQAGLRVDNGLDLETNLPKSVKK